MQKQNPSEDSPNRSQPSDEETHTLNPLARVEDTVMKTPWQVLEELRSDDNNNDSDSNSVRGASHGGAPAVVVGGGGGGGSVAVASAVASEEVKGKKRKGYELKDPPSGKPACPICHKEFLTWKGAFGHMRKHPDREYRGFFKPPVSDSSSSPVDQPLKGDNNKGDSAEKSIVKENSGEKGGLTASPSRGVVFDLNQPMGSYRQSPEPAEENNVDEGRNLGFDLNEMPSAEDHDE